MKILITGLSGFLGSQLANALITEYDIAGAIRSSSKLDRINCKSEITFINIEDEKWIEDVNKFNPKVVINTAALYGRKNESLSELIDANIVFPQKIIECMGEDTVFINCGTSLPSSVSLYAKTKNQFVELAKEYCKSNRIKFVNLRLEHFFGANDDSTKFTSYVIHQCLANRPLNLTEGTQKRDFIYIEDVISALKYIINSLSHLNSFENIDIGSGCAITIRDFVECVASVTASTSIIEFGAVPMRENELMYSCADTHRIKSLGWCLHFPLANAIADMIKKESK
ncbi:NAD-dependent epimerase/dehydratase family protein [Aeromonas veronii]|uniref:NAD-dependent epimerase/dehydratase family protein n=1 Tax=Aeromonas veronii TaxID=654 RepID=UPI001932F89F|nr:NAD(P)-dependent oxidoreductase [Aeromonas veronii]MBM0415977.1 NAD-dependent epimerase/dehydratase family protein [Aeromonas veronii]MBW3789171.1 NAD(P)-dependent oxidoreductase [Aeromonas veronii]